MPRLEGVWKQLGDMHLIKQFGTSQGVVHLALHLASDEASFMNGAIIPIDGGLSAY